MFSTTRSALPPTAVKEACSCCSTPTDLERIAATGRPQADDDAAVAAGAHTETDK